MADWKKIVLATGTSSQYIKGDGSFGTYSDGVGLGDANTWTNTNTFSSTFNLGTTGFTGSINFKRSSDGATVNTIGGWAPFTISSSGGTNPQIKLSSNTVYATGHTGIGVDPETDWKSNVVGLQIGAGGTLFARSDTGETKIYFAENVKWTADGFEYINNGPAGYIGLDGGTQTFAVAGSGNADAVASFTTALTIDNNGSSTFGEGVNLHKANATGLTSYITIRPSGTSSVYSGLGLGTSNSTLVLYVDKNNAIGSGSALVLQTGGTDALTINGSQNVGIGVTPEADWLSTRTALQIGGSGAIFGATTAGANGTFNIGQNVYFHSGGSYRRIDADEVSMYTQRDGTHIFRVAGSSTDNSTISFTDALTIDNSANVGIGITSPNATLHLEDGNDTEIRFSFANGQYMNKLRNEWSAGTASANKMRFHISDGSTTGFNEVLSLSGDKDATFFGDVNIATDKSIVYTPSVYTDAVQGIKFNDAVVTTGSIIQPVRLASNVGIPLFLGANSYVNTSGSIVRYNTNEESAYIQIDPRGDLLFGTSGTGANPSTRLHINSSGNSTFAGDVTMEGATGSTLTLKSTNTNITGSEIVGKVEAYISDASQTNLPGIAGDLYWATNDNLDGGATKGTDFALRVFRNDTLSQALVIESTKNATFYGNVGIGASPSDTLHLSASVPIIRLTDSDTNDYHRIYGSNGGLYFDADKGDSVGSSVIGFGVDDSRVMTLVSGGNVGIGTPNPSSPAGVGKFLHIAHTSHAGIVLQDTNSTAYDIFSADGHVFFYSQSLATNTVKIEKDGNVGIGTTSPLAKLVVSDGGNAGIELQPEISADTNRITNYDRTANAYMDFKLDALSHNIQTSGSSAIYIDSNGKVGIGTEVGSAYYSDELVVQVADSGGITIANTDTTHSAYLMFADGTTGDAIYRCQVGYDHNIDRFGIWTGATNALLIDSSQNTTLSGSTFLGKNANGQTSTTELGGYGVLHTDGSRYGNYGWLTFNAPTNNYTGGARGWAVTNAYLGTNFAILKSNTASGEPYLTTGGGAGTGTTAPFRIDGNGDTTFGGAVSMPTGNVSVGGKLNVASSVGIGDVGLEKTFSIAFADGVSDQKAQIQFTKFWGELEISVSGTFSNQNNAGVITKKYGLGVQSGSTYADESRYTESLGVTADNFAIGEKTWDSTNSRYYIPIVHRVATGNTCTVRVRCLGGDGAQTDFIEGLTVSSVYTTDTTVYDKPEVSFISPIGIDTANPEASLHIHGSTGIRLTDSNQNANEYAEIKYDNAGNTNLYINNDWTNSNALINFQLAGSTKMAVRGDGKVGIGTTQPDKMLHIASDDNVLATVESTTTHATIRLIDVDTSNEATLTRVGDNLEIVKDGGNVSIGKDNPTQALDVEGSIISSNVLLAPTYATFIHSFSDDMGTVGHYLPWNSSAETTGNDFSSTSFVVPMDMKLAKLLIRIESITNPGNHNLTVTLISKADGTISNTTVGSATKAFAAANSNKTVVYQESDFSSTPTLSKKQMGSIKLQFASDIGTSTDFFVTSVWEMDNNTL